MKKKTNDAELDDALARIAALQMKVTELEETIKIEREVTASASKQCHDAQEKARKAETKSGRLERVLKVIRDVVNLEFPAGTSLLGGALLPFVLGSAGLLALMHGRGM